METSLRTTATDDGAVTVTVIGEVDFSNSDEVAQGLHDAITDWSPQLLLVDLADATFIDSTGLGSLIEGYRTASEHGTDFRVINPSDTFRRVLSVTGLSDFFGLIGSDGLEIDGLEGSDRESDGLGRATGA
ncbi:MAG TPA: STAS domain-containing protein [Actinoplanes sp.]|nr:STAS domain-containing protein [Actinoplanes sp.]